MVQIYGHRWLSAYGDVTEEGVMGETAKTWQKALRGVTYEQIVKGLAKCLESGNSWPPSLPEFRALCLGKNHTKQPKQNAAAYRAPECLKLLRPKGNSEVARAHLQAMRRMLGQGAEADCVQEHPTQAAAANTERVHSELDKSPTQVEKAPISSTEAHALYSDASIAEGVQPRVKEKLPNYTAAQRKEIAPTPPARGEHRAGKPWCKSWRVSKYARGQGSKLPSSAPPARAQSQAFTVQKPQPP